MANEADTPFRFDFINANGVCAMSEKGAIDDVAATAYNERRQPVTYESGYRLTTPISDTEHVLCSV